MIRGTDVFPFEIYVCITITGSIALLVDYICFVHEGIIHPVVSASVLTWFIRYICSRNLHFLNHNILLLSTPEETVLLCARANGEGTIYRVCLPRRHYRKTVPEGEDNNMFSTTSHYGDKRKKIGKFVGVYRSIDLPKNTQKHAKTHKNTQKHIINK